MIEATPTMLHGMEVIESPDRPRYVLPDEVCPGVPWPAGFRDEINEWSRSFLGEWNVVPRGTAYVLGGNTVVMNPADAAELRKAVHHANYKAQT